MFTPYEVLTMTSISGNGGSAVGREVQPDLTGRRIGPACRHDLGPRVEPYALRAVDGGVAEDGGLPPAEGVRRQGHRDRHVDPHHPPLDLALEATGARAVAGEDRRPVAVRVGVHEGQRVL